MIYRNSQKPQEPLVDTSLKPYYVFFSVDGAKDKSDGKGFYHYDFVMAKDRYDAFATALEMSNWALYELMAKADG